MNAPLRRPGLRPPQPVDPSNPQWLAMFYQWVIDCLTHLDECMDKTQIAHQETQTEISVWMTAAKNFDQDFDARLQQHIDAHHEIDRVEKAKKSVWLFQWDAIREIGKVAGSGTAIGTVLYILNHLL